MDDFYSYNLYNQDNKRKKEKYISNPSKYEQYIDYILYIQLRDQEYHIFLLHVQRTLYIYKYTDLITKYPRSSLVIFKSI